MAPIPCGEDHTVPSDVRGGQRPRGAEGSHARLEGVSAIWVISPEKGQKTKKKKSFLNKIQVCYGWSRLMKGESGAQLYPVQQSHGVCPGRQWEPQKGFSWQEVWETWFRKSALDVGAEETEERQEWPEQTGSRCRVLRREAHTPEGKRKWTPSLGKEWPGAQRRWV